MRGRIPALVIVWSAGSVLALEACIKEPEIIGFACDPDGTCPRDLVCNDRMVCVLAGDLDASTVDAGRQDAGHDAEPPDAGRIDGGRIDSGVPCPNVPEICNDEDEDCDGVYDNSCPSGPVSFGMTSSVTALVGGPGINVWEERQGCPSGQVVIGFHGGFGAFMDRLGESCGIPAVLEDRSVVPFRYRVEVQTGDRTPERGGPGGGAFDKRCPGGNMVVAGVNGKYSNVIVSFGFSCATLLVVGSPESGFTFQENGARTAVEPVGGVNTAVTIFELNCPPGQAVVWLKGQDDSYDIGDHDTGLVSGLGLVCRPLLIEVEHPGP